MTVLDIHPAMFKKLVLKDWQLYQKIIAGYVGAAILALALLGSGQSWSGYIGSTVIITLLMSVGLHIIMTSIIIEKKEQTVPFIMSLPVSPTDFYLAKLVVNLSVFFLLWCMIIVVGTFLILYTPIVDGLLTIAILVLFQVLVNYCIVLAFAITTEKEGWAIFGIIFASILLQPFFLYLPKQPEIANFIEGDVFVWNTYATIVLGMQLTIVIVVLSSAWWFHQRKRTFL